MFPKCCNETLFLQDRENYNNDTGGEACVTLCEGDKFINAKL